MTMKKKKALQLRQWGLVLALLPALLWAGPRVYYVSPKGSDRAAGTL